MASRLVLLKARSLLPSLEPVTLEDDSETEDELRQRLIEYAAVKGRAIALGDRLRSGERGFHREGGTVILPPRGGSPDALAAAWARVLALTRRAPDEEPPVPGERYSVEQRTAEIEELILSQGSLTFVTLLGTRPTLGFAIVTFIALLDLYRRAVIDITQDVLFGEILIERKTVGTGGS